MFADPAQVESTLVNLVVNARDSMAGGGKLTIETGNADLDERHARAHAEVTPGQYTMISVTDTGIGMTPEVMGQAFDPFFTTKAPGKGTGLGLSQVLGFVKQSNGHVKIYSEVGHGTTVKVYLPRFTGEGPMAVTVDEGARPQSGRRRRTPSRPSTAWSTRQRRHGSRRIGPCTPPAWPGTARGCGCSATPPTRSPTPTPSTPTRGHRWDRSLRRPRGARRSRRIR